MGDPYKGRVAGHSLAHGAMPVYRKYPDHAMCECGANSPLFRTVEERRAWHRQHKADVIDAQAANGTDERGREVHL